MTRDDIIRMAREAGLCHWGALTLVKGNVKAEIGNGPESLHPCLEAFFDAVCDASNERLKRENAILRSELKHRISSDIIFTETDRDMTKEEAGAQAEKEITWMIAHNEGAE